MFCLANNGLVHKCRHNDKISIIVAPELLLWQIPVPVMKSLQYDISVSV